MESNADVYRQLQRHINNMPIPFPESESGLDIKLLQHFFTPEEAKIALALSALPEPHICNLLKPHKFFQSWWPIQFRPF